MIYDIEKLVSFYRYEAFAGLPAAVRLVYFASVVLSVIICCGGQRRLRNTANNVLWVTVLLIFPAAGVAAYLLLSVLPYRLWLRSGKSGRFPYRFELVPNQFKAIMIAGICLKCIRFIAHGSEHTETAAAFIMYLIVLFLDAGMTAFRRGVYMEIDSMEDSCVHEELLGRDFVRIFTKDRPLKENAARAAADMRFAEPEAENVLENGRLSYAGGRMECTVTEQGSEEFKTLDISKSRMVPFKSMHIMRRINSDSSGFTEKDMYAVYPRVVPFILRQAALLVLFAAWFTPAFTGAHMGIVSCISDISRSLAGMIWG